MDAGRSALRLGLLQLAIAFTVPAMIVTFLLWRSADVSTITSGALALVASGAAGFLYAWGMLRAFRIVRLERRLETKPTRIAACLEALGFRLKATGRSAQWMLTPSLTGNGLGRVFVDERDGVAVVTGPALAVRIAFALMSTRSRSREM